MSTLTPEQATFILAATALPSLNAEHPVTKRVIAAISAEKADFRPDTIDQLTRIIDFRGLFQLPAVVFVQVGLNHSIHHRGQLSMYLRPMGAKVPSIYGESYDAREAREKAQG
jgi:uncharacterized damage-inducible protein DinB